MLARHRWVMVPAKVGKVPEFLNDGFSAFSSKAIPFTLQI